MNSKMRKLVVATAVMVIVISMLTVVYISLQVK